MTKDRPYNPRNERENLDEILRLMMADLSECVTTWRATESTQWERSTPQSTVEDAGIRSKGGVSDPTGETVADERRQELRAQRVRVSRELARIQATIRTLTHDLARAVGAHS